jgi:hypothetical protein
VFAEALLKGRRTPPGPGTCDPVARSSGYFTWTPVGSLRSPGDPSRAFAPLLDPGRTDMPLPWRSHRYCPPLTSTTKASDNVYISRLNHAASTPALLRFALRVATRAQGWLPAGWLAFTGRAPNPLDHDEGFQIKRSFPLPVLLTLRCLFSLFLALSFASVTLSRPCHVSSPLHVATQRADFPHYAPLFASPQSLWDLSRWGSFRSEAPHSIAVEQLESVI